MSATAYFEPQLERIPVEELNRYQVRRLREVLAHALQHSPYYRDALSGVSARDVRSLEDLRHLPLTEPGVFRARAREFVAARASHVFSSGGSTGRPKYSYYAPEDLLGANTRTARALVSCGITSADRVLNVQAFELWLIGHDFLRGCEQVGAFSIPVGKGPWDYYTVQFIKDLAPTAGIFAPSHLARLAEYVRELGLSPEDLGLRRLVLTGEPLEQSRRTFLERTWRAPARCIYGTGEMETIGAECAAGQGYHFMEDHFIVEILPAADLVGHESAPAGVGELVLTTLSKWAQPLIRYRSGDLVVPVDGPCPCGRTHLRAHVLGRAEETIYFGDGDKVFAFQLEALMAPFPEFSDWQLHVSRREGELDSFVLLAVPDASRAADFAGGRDRLEEAFRVLSVDFAPAVDYSCTVAVRLVGAGELYRTPKGKRPRFVDLRHPLRDLVPGAPDGARPSVQIGETRS